MLGRDEWWTMVARSQFGGTGCCGYGFFYNKKLSWFCLDLRCELCDVGWLELFGFEEDE